jgi:chromate reductase, NAD(P)H dehydrogenase (quinone)
MSSDTHDSAAKREPVAFLVFSASLRAGSLNSRLARLAAQTIEQHGGTLDLATMEEFDAPSYDQDMYESDGLPPGAKEFRRRLEARIQFLHAWRAQERDRL